jgi:hypothetical protein
MNLKGLEFVSVTDFAVLLVPSFCDSNFKLVALSLTLGSITNTLISTVCATPGELLTFNAAVCPA